MIKITEVEKKLGKGVYFCDYCQTYQSEQAVPKHKYIKWDVCGNCYNKHFSTSKARERRQIRKAKREAKRQNAQFIIELFKAKDLKYIIDAFSNINDEGTVIFSSKGMCIVQMDPSRIGVMSMSLTPKYFSKFKFSIEKQFISINLDELRKVFEKIDENAPICLSIIKHKISEKSIFFLSIKVDKREFEVVLLDSRDDEDIPDKNLLNIFFPCDFTLPTNEFYNIIDNALLYSERISFKAKANQSELKITSEGDKGKFTYTLELSEIIKEEIDVIHNLTFLRSILPVITFVPEIKIYLRTDKPIRIDISLRNRSSLFYFQAPREYEPEDEDEWR